MTLDELLTELRQNILHDRSDQIEGQTDRLWSDETLTHYINEAERRFARRALVIRDATTPDVTEVTLVEGQTDYTLHDSVIAVMSARYLTEEYDLQRLDHSMLAQWRPAGLPLYDEATARLLPPGKPLAFTTDEEIKADSEEDTASAVCLRVYPAPTAEYAGEVIKLRVFRLPLNKLVAPKQRPEIPAVHHMDILDWAAYLALRIVDHDSGDVARAHEFRKMFEDHVKEARQEVMRKMYAPVGWSFGRGGFAWEH